MTKNPQVLEKKNIIESNYESFMLSFNRAMYIYITEQQERENTEKSSDSSAMILQKVNSVRSVNNDNVHNGNIDNGMQDNDPNNQRESCNANMEDVKNLSLFSTKEEFSDYEDEVEAFESCLQTNLNEVNHPLNAAQVIHTPAINFQVGKINHNNYNNFNSPSKPTKVIQTNSEFFKDKTSNFYLYQKDFVPKAIKPNSILNQLPLLKSFKPKYTKRENIDKKILRRFKLFVKEKYKSKHVKIDNKVDSHFWIIFLNGSLFPPMKFFDNSTNEEVEFKSFNSAYLLWLFSKKGAKEFYDLFISSSGKEIAYDLIEDYSVSDSTDISQLENYINNLPFIFDISSINNSSKNAKSSDHQAPMPVHNQDQNNFMNFSSNMKELFFSKDSFDQLDDSMFLRRMERSREMDSLKYDMFDRDFD